MSDTKKRIMRAARELFESNGFEATTTKEIAARAGMSEVTLFRHFETKRNLFEQTVHESMHPYKLEEYLKNNVCYDLEKDLKTIADNMMKTYGQNLPLMRMVFKDKMKGTRSKIYLRQHENNAKKKLEEYFEQMYKMGKMKAEPQMAMKFFMSNIMGVFMRNAFSNGAHKYDKKYFDWMIDRIIYSIKN